MKPELPGYMNPKDAVRCEHCDGWIDTKWQIDWWTGPQGIVWHNWCPSCPYGCCPIDAGSLVTSLSMTLALTPDAEVTAAKVKDTLEGAHVCRYCMGSGSEFIDDPTGSPDEINCSACGGTGLGHTPEQDRPKRPEITHDGPYPF